MRFCNQLVLVAIFSLKWMTSLAVGDTIFCSDPGLCSISKRFLRFGRDTADEPYFRLTRIGHGYRPYHDKRFLRFGRSGLQEIQDYPNADILDPEGALYRKRRSADSSNQQDDESPRSKRSAELPGHLDVVVKDVEKRDAGDEEVEKRFMRFGRAGNDDVDDKEKRFMRFGRGDEDFDEGEKAKRFMRFGKRFMRFGRDMEGPDKRFMRFGKRFMRFGKSLPDFDEDPEAEKRFMRFGKRSSLDVDDFPDGLAEAENGVNKRFMRFGKRFMRFGRSDGNDLDMDKRFMRFGKSGEADKRFMRFGKSSPEDDVEKRFMRFGKRFMRFGRSSGEKRFMRFGKRSTRSAEQSAMENSPNLQASL